MGGKSSQKQRYSAYLLWTKVEVGALHTEQITKREAVPAYMSKRNAPIANRPTKGIYKK
jgi:hypothetical protein